MKLVTFGLNAPDIGQYGIVDDMLCVGTESVIHEFELRMRGRHNLANALAAMATMLGIKPSMLSVMGA